MKQSYCILCPFLEGSHEGAHCNICKQMIKNMPAVDIRLCMSARYEVCFIYISELYRENYFQTHR